MTQDNGPAVTREPDRCDGKGTVFKTIGRTIGFVLALPGLVGYALGTVVWGKERAFALTSERLAVRGGLLGIYTRQAFYRYTTGGVGRDVCFGFMSVFSKPAVRIGQRVYIGRFCAIGWAEIQDDVMLADGVQVLSGRHQHGSAPRGGRPWRDNGQTFRRVTIGPGAWIGAGAVVMADVGEGAVVGAGAVVVKPVPAGARVGGVPAKELGAGTKRRLKPGSIAA
jgi:acetyltransferase-like isoleucine patch superfamily enzyme